MIMTPNPTLSIAIPTYNRADFLERSLAIHVPIMKKYKIQMFVSDNASDDNTLEILKKWNKEYPLLNYSISEKNLGPDKNFQIALEQSDSEYTWLLGDTSEIKLTELEKVLKVLTGNTSYDLVVTNLMNTMEHPSSTYEDKNELLQNLSGIMSCMSCLIYKKTTISNSNFSRYVGSFYIQTGIILEQLSDINFKVHWMQDVSVGTLADYNLKKSGWAHTNQIFDIGLTAWANFIFSLPISYSLDSKFKACKNFGISSGAFTIKGMILLRQKKLLDYKIYKKYKNTLKISITYPTWIVLIISITPTNLINKLLRIYKATQRNSEPKQ
ncbi:transferase [Pseudomonas marginalis]|uniref:Transferase n=2 Tax=Pseudomonas marginalis TaxID=298 RepID=A0A9X5QLU8_PSEMA|nr:transferase [Pseudomonas marginalis]